MPLVNPAAARPSTALPIDNVYTSMTRNPLVMAILQAQMQQRQEQAAKAQVMQALGFGENPMPMGAIPRGHGISIMDGKAWTRPGGTPPGIQMLMNALLGLKESPYIDSFGPLQPQGGMGSSPLMEQNQNSVVATARKPNGAQQSNELVDPATLELLLQQLSGGGMVNSGQWQLGAPNTNLPPRSPWRY